MLRIAPNCFIIVIWCLASASANEEIAAPEASKPSTQARDYLPVILQKGLAQIAREHERDLSDTLKLMQILATGGEVGSLELAAIKQVLLQQSVRVLRRETAFKNALDKYKLKHKVAAKQLHELEKAVLDPFLLQLQHPQKIDADLRRVLQSAAQFKNFEQAGAFRAHLRKLATESQLVQGMDFRKEFPLRWAVWEVLKDKDALRRRRELEHEQRKLLDEIFKHESRGKPVPLKMEQQQHGLEFEIDVGRFELALRKVDRRMPETRAVVHCFKLLMLEARNQRMARAKDFWPLLPKVQYKGTDLLMCDAEKAEQLVASSLRNPEAALSAKANVRRVRELAQSYMLQRRILELSYHRLEGARSALQEPTPPMGTVRPVDLPQLIRQLINAQANYATAKRELVRTWMSFQIARRDLTPPLWPMSPKQ